LLLLLVRLPALLPAADAANRGGLNVADAAAGLLPKPPYTPYPCSPESDSLCCAAPRHAAAFLSQVLQIGLDVAAGLTYLHPAVLHI
jgi:hypothetical protein